SAATHFRSHPRLTRPSRRSTRSAEAAWAIRAAGGGLSTDPGGGAGGGTGPLGNPGVLLIDLLHGDQVVQSAQTLVPQATAADDAWRVRLHLAAGTPDHLTYPSALT